MGSTLAQTRIPICAFDQTSLSKNKESNFNQRKKNNSFSTNSLWRKKQFSNENFSEKVRKNRNENLKLEHQNRVIIQLRTSCDFYMSICLHDEPSQSNHFYQKYKQFVNTDANNDCLKHLFNQNNNSSLKCYSNNNNNNNNNNRNKIKKNMDRVREISDFFLPKRCSTSTIVSESNENTISSSTIRHHNSFCLPNRKNILFKRNISSPGYSSFSLSTITTASTSIVSPSNTSITTINSHKSRIKTFHKTHSVPETIEPPKSEHFIKSESKLKSKSKSNIQRRHSESENLATYFNTCDINYYNRKSLKKQFSIQLDSTANISDKDKSLLCISRSELMLPMILCRNSFEEYSNDDEPENLSKLIRKMSDINTENTNPLLKDTRTRIIIELYETEKSYVESLQLLLSKYYDRLKIQEFISKTDKSHFETIFYQIPELFCYHKEFLNELKIRLNQWDLNENIGDIILNMLTKTELMECYVAFVNNWKKASEILSNLIQSKPMIAKFLEQTASQIKGKLPIDSLLIKPVQKCPKYELLIKRLLKNTKIEHSDYQYLILAEAEIQRLLKKINYDNKTKNQEHEKMYILKEIESLINFTENNRSFIRFDNVQVLYQGTKKERMFFLFSDVLLIIGIKKRNTGSKSTGNIFDNNYNKYKFITEILLENIQIVKDEQLYKFIDDENEILNDDRIEQKNTKTNRIGNNQYKNIEIKSKFIQNENDISSIKMVIDTQYDIIFENDNYYKFKVSFFLKHGHEYLTVMFISVYDKIQWQKDFSNIQQKLELIKNKWKKPKFVTSIPIKQTKLKCAALAFDNSTKSDDNSKDIWICNDNEGVDQVCVLTLNKDRPTMTTYNAVCNSRIECIIYVPAFEKYSRTHVIRNELNRSNDSNDSFAEINEKKMQYSNDSLTDDENSDKPGGCIKLLRKNFRNRLENHLDISWSSSSDENNEYLQATMWIGTDNGLIYIFNCYDNIRNHKKRLNLKNPILNMTYVDNKVFAALNNGDIVVYFRDECGIWKIDAPVIINIGTHLNPVIKMLSNSTYLIYATSNLIKVIDIDQFEIDHDLEIQSDIRFQIKDVVIYEFGLWTIFANSSIIKCYNANNFNYLFQINVATAVTKILKKCDNIIRQHKVACLRVTSLLSSKDLLWIGTNTGVILNMPIPTIEKNTTYILNVPNITGLQYGHTGQIRFLINMITEDFIIRRAFNNINIIENAELKSSIVNHFDQSFMGCSGNGGGGSGGGSCSSKVTKSKRRKKINLPTTLNYYVITGGDGYEEFPNATTENLQNYRQGHDDSSSYLLLWSI